MLRNLLASVAQGRARGVAATLQAAVEARAAGRADEAMRLARRAHEADTTHAGAQLLLAHLLLEAGDNAEALRLARAAVALAPSSPDAQYVLARALGASGEVAESEAVLRQTLELDPGDAVAAVVLATLLLRSGRHADAEAVMRLVLAANPDSPEVHATLGLALRLRGKAQEALGHFEAALRARPDDVGHVNNYALCLRDLDRLDEAAATLERALTASQTEATTLVNLANVLRELGRSGECLDALEALVRAEPDNADARTTLAKMLADGGATERARREFDAALASNPASPEIRLARGMHRLARRDFAGGWADYAARLLTTEWPSRELPFPEWDGGSFAGKAVLVYAEQGLGDEIMFAGCFPDLIAEAERCVIECDPRLERLFGRSFPAASVFAGRLRRKHPWLARAGEIDLQVATGSLPRRFRDDSARFPSHDGYLRADPELVAHYSERLAGLEGGVRVGIAWRGGVARTRQALRTIPAPEWLPLAERRELCLISLQHGPVDEDLAALRRLVPGRDVHHWPEVQQDIEHLAALVCALDMTVSACNATVHLAGALGRSVLALVPSAPEWRYGLEGEAMVWYPSVRLVRQRVAGEWGEVMRRAAARVG
ncbi:MAG TPA: tetratricopeptide repeat protein [Burkholderiales bacterium]|nr:tetratricopeptide repeat protein [Burkholderiales bacterium]